MNLKTTDLICGLTLNVPLHHHVLL